MPDLERMVEKDIIPERDIGTHTALSHLLITNFDFITYFNLLEVINCRY